MPPTKASKKQIGIILAILVIAIVFVLVMFGPDIFDNPIPGATMTKINESSIPNGKIIHVSDKDFEAFPQIAPIFHGTKQGFVVDANGTRITYGFSLSYEEAPKFYGSFFGRRQINQTTGEDEIFYEYNGSYYYFGGVSIP